MMRFTKGRARLPLPIAIVLNILLCGSAGADTPADASARGESSVSVEDRRSAADAYDKGTTAYLSGDYKLAAHWFEHAYRLAPTSTALLQAVRAQHRAGRDLRAANLTLLLKEKYPSNENARELTKAILESAQRDHLLVQASCDGPCALEVDGEVAEHDSFFVSPDEEHVIKAEYENGDTETTVSGPAGSARTVQLAGPPPPASPPIPRWAFFSSLGATLALGAVTVWSGMDARNGVDAYEDAAAVGDAELAQSLYQEGQSKEKRTNALIGTTAGMAAVTVVFGVLTDWKGQGRETKPRSVEPSLSISKTGGFAALRGRF